MLAFLNICFELISFFFPYIYNGGEKTMDRVSKFEIIKEDSLLRKMAEENSHKVDDKMKWGDIADVMNREGNIRTGKQCR